MLQNAVQALADDDPAVVSVVSSIEAEANMEIPAERLLQVAKAEVVVKRWGHGEATARCGRRLCHAALCSGLPTDQGIMVGFEVDIMGCLGHADAV